MANASVNAASLGATVFPLGIIGDDFEGKRLASELSDFRIGDAGLVRDRHRKTTVKTRILAVRKWRSDPHLRECKMSEGDLLRLEAIKAGIPPEKIRVTGSVSTTEDEAREVANIPGVRSVLLVTSAFHMRRAALLFRTFGLEVAPFPTDIRSMVLPSNGPLLFVSTAQAAYGSDTALRE